MDMEEFGTVYPELQSGDDTDPAHRQRLLLSAYCNEDGYTLGQTLTDNISDYFRIDEIRENLTACENYRSTSEKAHGQFETRKYYITDDITWFAINGKLEGIKSIGMVETTITKGEKTTVERRYYISSLAAHIDLFMKAVRGH
ncbi:hypothetical protein [Treponema phagedenis]|uniref:Uncharacterized protein n=1 Tax=Treponema phagedenis TaxID=162 RepID=A0A0B7GRH8_TREPH|nr:hypothetical protein [Treponema phagedenis]QEK00464.1 hypothetical protein FUT84_04235 [Treponema phagedenis]QEK05474.1 hypothetical protein FUT80_01150 [Treponema phagedenis]CEM61028.1 conserved hypothetical protein [Treponema phagedenis]